MGCWPRGSECSFVDLLKLWALNIPSHVRPTWYEIPHKKVLSLTI